MSVVLSDYQVTINAKTSGKARTVYRNGREFLVGRAVILREGVLNGSKGPIYYPKRLFAEYADWWNGVFATVRHPTENDKPVSARRQEVIDRYGVGHTFNAEGGEVLSVDVYVDVLDATRVDPRIVNAMRRGDPIELSTGVFTSETPAEPSAAFNNTPYQFVANTLRPDHLAILPDETGACSITDGCGLLVKNQIPNDGGNTVGKSELVSWLTTNCDCWKQQGDADLLNNMGEDKLKALKAKAEKHAELVANAAKPKPADPQSPPVPPTSPPTVPPAVPPTVPPAVPPVPATNATMTPAEWFRVAPPEVQMVVRTGVKVVNERKQAIVDRLTANTAAERKEASAKFFMAKDLEELELLEANLPEPAPATNKADDDFPSWMGRLAAPPVNNKKYEDDPEFVLPAPGTN